VYSAAYPGVYALAIRVQGRGGGFLTPAEIETACRRLEDCVAAGDKRVGLGKDRNRLSAVDK